MRDFFCLQNLKRNQWHTLWREGKPLYQFQESGEAFLAFLKQMESEEFFHFVFSDLLGDLCPRFIHCSSGQMDPLLRHVLQRLLEWERHHPHSYICQLFPLRTMQEQQTFAHQLTQAPLVLPLVAVKAILLVLQELSQAVS